MDSRPHCLALRKQEESEPKQLRRVLLHMGHLHKQLEPEQGDKDLSGGLQKKDEMSLEHLFVL